MAKKIRMSEQQIINNFNDEGKPMSEFEKFMAQPHDDLKHDNFDSSSNDFDEEDLFDGEDEDDRYNTMFITSRLYEAMDALHALEDYLEESDYAKERGGEKFKGYVEKIKSICEQLEDFL